MTPDISHENSHPATGSTYPWTIYRGATDTTPAMVEELTWPEIGDAIRELVTQTAPEKDRLLAIGPHRLRNGTTRAKTNVEQVTLIALDVDRDLSDLEVLLSRIRGRGLAAIVHTSPSDKGAGAPSRKVRLYLRPARPMTAAEALAVRVAVARQLGVTLDPTTSDASRLYYIGQVDGTEAREVYEIEGDDVPIDDVLAEGGPLIASTANDDGPSELPAASDRELSDREQASLDELATIIEPHFERGQRNATALAIGGLLRNAGLPPSAAEHVIDQLPSDDPAARKRDALRAWQIERAAGHSKLAEILPAEAMARIDAVDLRPQRQRDASARHARLLAERDAKARAHEAAKLAAQAAAEPAKAELANDHAEPDNWFSRFGRIVALGEKPARFKYLVDGLPFAGGGKVNAVQGAPNAGKSPFALLLAICVAAGLPFLGRRIREPGPVLYIDGETGLLAHIRFHRLCFALSVDPAALPVEFADIEVSFTAEFLAALEAHLRATPQRLMVIDTYGALLGADIDTSTPEFAHWLRQLGLLARRVDVVIVVLIHEKKAGRGKAGASLEDIAGNFQGAGAMQGVIALARTGEGNEAPIRVACSRAPEASFKAFEVLWSDTDWRDGAGDDPGQHLGLKAAVVDGDSGGAALAAAAAADQTATKRAKVASKMVELLERNPGQVERTVIKAAKGLRETERKRIFDELVDDGVLLQSQPANKIDPHGVVEPVTVYSVAPCTPAVVEARMRWGIIQ